MRAGVPVTSDRRRVRVSHPINPLEWWVGYLTEAEIYRYRLAGYIVSEV